MSNYIVRLRFKEGPPYVPVEKKFRDVDDEAAILHAIDLVKRESIIDSSVIAGFLYREIPGVKMLIKIVHPDDPV